MGEAKIEIKVGEVSFSGEGDGKWLSDQLDKLLEKIPELAKVRTPRLENGGSKPDSPAEEIKAAGTLASFLKAKKALDNQVRKFLATAAWLHDSQNTDRLATGDVSKALSANRQGKLTNASDCLNSNVEQGFCEKDGKHFFVTDEGRTNLG
jgi:hypothetical protein